MGTPYTLRIKNNAEISGKICVYTELENKIYENLLSLAWLVKGINPGVDTRFDWSNDFSFHWDEKGELHPGVRFESSQVVQADPRYAETNRTLFEKTKTGFWFPQDKTGAAEPPKGALGITCDSSIPNNEALIGIGISGVASLAIPAYKNFQFNFEPHLRYYLAFGDFVQGDVIDVNKIASQVLEVEFKTGEYDKTAILTKDNTWSLA